ncbi:MAG: hypothetical protein LBR38_06005 [Synergistaceae bacterium]|jgi:hypothetical protein|nr:hypothetical protein [Synergistaceae bacterium]
MEEISSYLSALQEVCGMAVENARKLERLDSVLEDVKRILRGHAAQMETDNAMREKSREADLAAYRQEREADFAAFREMFEADAEARRQAREKDEADRAAALAALRQMLEEDAAARKKAREEEDDEYYAALEAVRSADEHGHIRIDDTGCQSIEFDWLLKDRYQLLAVTVSDKLSIIDVDTHLEKLGKLEKFRFEKRIYGVVAGAAGGSRYGRGERARAGEA